MPSYNLPWIIGPAPIIVTVWAGFSYINATTRGTGITSDNFIAPFFVSNGAVSFVAFYLWRGGCILQSFILSQIIVVICICVLFRISSRFSTSPDDDISFISIKNNNSTITLLRDLSLSVLSYLVFNISAGLVAIGHPCTLGKCRAIEIIVGRRDAIFGPMYLANMLGSLCLWAVAVGFARLAVRLKTKI